MRPLTLGLILAAFLVAWVPAKPLGLQPGSAQRAESKRGITAVRHDSKTAQAPKKTLSPKRSKRRAGKRDKVVVKSVAARSPLLLILDDLGLC